MRRLLLTAALVFAASGASAAQRVVVLAPPSASENAWPSGQRAVVAELMASDVELVLRTSRAKSFAMLEDEVLDAAGEPETDGAVGVGREGSLGFALAALHAGRSAVRIEDDVRGGPVAEGAVALRVSEVLRVRNFELPPEERREPAAPGVAEPPLAPVWPWVAVAALAARGASGVAPAAALGLRVPISDWASLEPAGAFTLRGLRANTSAGEVTLSARQATFELVIAPSARHGLSAGAAAGAGFAWLSAIGRANAGYVASERSTQVALLALRGFGAWQTRHLRLLAFLELSALLPAVSVRAAGNEVARLGQPWLMSGVALGYSP